jgi:hypothetical protein
MSEITWFAGVLSDVSLEEIDRARDKLRSTLPR